MFLGLREREVRSDPQHHHEIKASENVKKKNVKKNARVRWERLASFSAHIIFDHAVS